MTNRKARAHGRRSRRFGKLLSDLRELRLGKKSSYEQVAEQLAKRGIAPLSGSTVHRYEREGRIPDALAILGFADLYRVNANELSSALLADLSSGQMPHVQELLAPPTKDITVTDEQGEDISIKIVPVLTHEIAAGPPLQIDPEQLEQIGMPFHRTWLRSRGIKEPWCVRVGSKEQSMLGTINPGDIVLIDCSEERRSEPQTDKIYAVNVDDGTSYYGGTLKRVLVVPNEGIWLVADNPDKTRFKTLRLELSEPDAAVQTGIVGQVMWWGKSL